ncbi:ABC transporter permease [Lactobacillus sp. ESL0681]|uniref:ABC transporter permease n=1 Tax=Lactobacillus sp. ESL0681 TaxID=2983211 RepID=UPI0023F63559|nr:ABC transporter permease [Lactobacillus sp. ESL0681]WEV41054.1 ABC transporter permease [Lactobacillus sp. ESL0681]
MRKLWTIISETYSRQVKSWSFLLLVLGPFLLLAVSLGAGYLAAVNSGELTKPQIAVISSQADLRQNYAAQSKVKIKQSITTQAAAKKAVKQDQIKGYLLLTNTHGKLEATFYHGDNANTPKKADINATLIQLQSSLNIRQGHLTSQQLQALQVQPNLKTVSLNNSSNNDDVRYITIMVVLIIIYMIVLTYASIITQEIAGDKSHKIIEVIFSSTTPGVYVCGKIIALLLMIMTQLVAYVLMALAALATAQTIPTTKDWLAANQPVLGEILHNFTGSIVLYIVLGVVAYTVLSAYFGALVKSSDNAAKAAQPASMLAIAGFLIAITFINQPQNILVKILSYVPLFSSYLMPVRMFADKVNSWEVLVSLLLLLVTICGFLWYLCRVYGKLMLQKETPKWRFSLFKK